MRKDFEQAPLVSGRSVVADEICPPFLHIAESYKKKNPDVKPNDNDDVNLRSFAKFTENCSRRRDLESRIRTERKLPLETPVPIPLLALERYRCWNTWELASIPLKRMMDGTQKWSHCHRRVPHNSLKPVGVTTVFGISIRGLWVLWLLPSILVRCIRRLMEVEQEKKSTNQFNSILAESL